MTSLPSEPSQDLLRPHALCEWLPDDYLAHFISETIDALHLSALYKRYEGGGSRNQPFHPAMMVKVVVYRRTQTRCRFSELTEPLH